MSVIDDFATLMVNEGYGTLGTDLFIGTAPLEAPAEVNWIVAGGGTSTLVNQTGERTKQYVVDIYFRSNSAQAVYDKMFAFEDMINSGDCASLENFDTIDIEASVFPADQDLDSEERTIGLVQVTLTLYK